MAAASARRLSRTAIRRRPTTQRPRSLGKTGDKRLPGIKVKGAPQRRGPPSVLPETVTMSGAQPPQKQLSSVDLILLEKWDQRLELSMSRGRLDALFADLPPAGNSLRPLMLHKLI